MNAPAASIHLPTAPVRPLLQGALLQRRSLDFPHTEEEPHDDTTAPDFDFLQPCIEASPDTWGWTKLGPVAPRMAMAYSPWFRWHVGEGDPVRMKTEPYAVIGVSLRPWLLPERRTVTGRDRAKKGHARIVVRLRGEVYIAAWLGTDHRGFEHARAHLGDAIDSAKTYARLLVEWAVRCKERES